MNLIDWILFFSLTYNFYCQLLVSFAKINKYAKDTYLAKRKSVKCKRKSQRCKSEKKVNYHNDTEYFPHR